MNKTTFTTTHTTLTNFEPISKAGIKPAFAIAIALAIIGFCGYRYFCQPKNKPLQSHSQPTQPNQNTPQATLFRQEAEKLSALRLGALTEQAKQEIHDWWQINYSEITQDDSILEKVNKCRLLAKMVINHAIFDTKERICAYDAHGKLHAMMICILNSDHLEIELLCSSPLDIIHKNKFRAPTRLVTEACYTALLHGKQKLRVKAMTDSVGFYRHIGFENGQDKDPNVLQLPQEKFRFLFEKLKAV